MPVSSITATDPLVSPVLPGGQRRAAGALLAGSWLTPTGGECNNLRGFVLSLSVNIFT